ncbi:substrate-binding domain-containing protein [Pseudarthrobacter sp. HLT3-5]|uniref:substrate-binding domain-containing protein n=1 Tax=Pseudarthrobacter cellobiosi TaxID=2953654 RepID=UPI00208F2198|nr:substrate-binding domain-containing protein [Pseudarthrobacter sp. HLT3-5]MCO4274855.1 substrate-binding domain-containing protein [Pseudarthrobacter sp. HLT3-5]
MTACSGPSIEPAVRGSLTAVGTGIQSSSVSAWRGGWVKDNPGSSLNFSPDGSGVGLDALFSGQAHFAPVDAPLTAEDIARSRQSCGPDGAFSVPVSVVALGVAFNLPSAKNVKLTTGVLGSIYSGDITKWDDPAITGINPGTEFPNQEIIPVRSTESSVMTQTATEYLAAGSWDGQPGMEWAPDTAGETVRGYADIADKLDNTAGSIAFLEKSAIGSRFDTALLDFGKGFVRMNDDTLNLSIGSGTVGSGPGGSVTFETAGMGGDGYGLSLVTYQAYCGRYANESLSRLVKSWGTFVVGDGGQGNSTYFAGVASPGKEALELAKDRIEEIDAAA